MNLEFGLEELLIPFYLNKKKVTIRNKENKSLRLFIRCLFMW